MAVVIIVTIKSYIINTVGVNTEVLVVQIVG